MNRHGTLSVLAARPAVDALAELGIDVEPVLKAAQLTRRVLASFDNRLPHRSVHELWEAAASVAGDCMFGVHVAEALPFGAYDVIDYLYSCAPTVGEGLMDLTRYARIIYDRSDVRLFAEPRNGRFVRHVAVPAPQYDEFSLALLLLRSRGASGVHWSPKHVRFQHHRRGPAAELSKLFGCPATFGEAETEMILPLDVLRLPHQRADAQLLAILTRYADVVLHAVPGGADLAASTAAVIANHMSSGAPTLLSTAAALRYRERTLQRRLSELGTTHSRLLDRVRRDLALKYIGDPRRTISEIAYLLHFGDAASFHRAFKRWTGEAPSDYRRHLFG